MSCALSTHVCKGAEHRSGLRYMVLLMSLLSVSTREEQARQHSSKRRTAGPFADVSSLSLFNVNAAAAHHPSLWVAQAGQLVQQFDELAVLARSSSWTAKIKDGERAQQGTARAANTGKLPLHLQVPFLPEASDADVKALGSLLNSRGSDKHSHGAYTHTYTQIFQALGGRNAKLRILEVGLGTNNTNVFSNMGRLGRPGASLRAWRDYLPRAQIFGADYDSGILFTEYRITTSWVDQMKPETLQALFRHFGSEKFDLVIDDGMHAIGTCLNMILFGIRTAVAPGGWLVIEDIGFRPAWKMVFNTIDVVLSTMPNLQTAWIKHPGYAGIHYVVHLLPENKGQLQNSTKVNI